MTGYLLLTKGDASFARTVPVGEMMRAVKSTKLANGVVSDDSIIVLSRATHKLIASRKMPWSASLPASKST